MIVTEEMARSKWCPMKTAEPDGLYGSDDKCVASNCMFWRFISDKAYIVNKEEIASLHSK